LLVKANEKETEKLVYNLWKTLYPKMMTGYIEFIEFSQFKAKLLEKKNSATSISFEDVEKEINQVIAAYEGQGK
jgi:hypothetical protein